MWNLSNLATAVEGQLVGDGDVIVRGVSIDSRQIKEGELFIPLVGEHFDGHDFIEAVETKQASAIISSRPHLSTSLPVIYVKDTYTALYQWAAWLRGNFKGEVVGITGSCGKTTVKNILSTLLRTQGNTLATQGNYNNEIGVPLTLCDLTQDHDYAVIEMGAAKPGDIDYLTQLTQPNISVITCIASAHLAGLGSLDQVAEVKGEILDALHTDGLAILPHDSRYLHLWEKRLNGKKQLTFGLGSQADYRADHLIFSKTGMVFDLYTHDQKYLNVKLPLWGKHNVINALAAIAVADYLGLSLQDIVAGLEKIHCPESRLGVFTSHQGIRVFNDTYNANPEAMKAALDVLNQPIWGKGKRIAILGGMYDLGDYTREGHQAVGRYAASTHVDLLLTVGQYAEDLGQAFVQNSHRQWLHYHTNHDLISGLNNGDDQLWQAANVLIKGSRATHLEDVVSFFNTK